LRIAFRFEIAHIRPVERSEAVNESVWKSRFIARLSELFRSMGTSSEFALADAEAHADDHHPRRSDASPELEADAVFRSLGDG